MLTKNGVENCYQEVRVMDDNEHSNSPNTTCDININNYKEVHYDKNIVAFFPLHQNSTYNYHWTVRYENNSSKESLEKIPLFEYSTQHKITSVTLKILSKQCLKEFTKTYEENFWKVFK